MDLYDVHGLLVTDVNNKLMGIVTNRDIRYETDENKKAMHLMTPIEKLVTAKKGVTMDEAKRLFNIHKKEKLPIIDDNGILQGLITNKDIYRRSKFPLATKDE